VPGGLRRPGARYDPTVAEGKPYLHDFYKQADKADAIFKFRVYTLRSTEAI
jgi:hypothetical protein